MNSLRERYDIYDFTNKRYDQTKIQKLFDESCLKNDLELAKELWSEFGIHNGLNWFYKKTYLSLNILNKELYNACSNHYYEMSKWIYKISITEHIDYNTLIMNCINHNNLIFMKWLINESNYYLISSNFYNYILTSCIKNNYEIMKWLLTINPEFDNFNFIFAELCNYNDEYYDIIKYFINRVSCFYLSTGFGDSLKNKNVRITKLIFRTLIKQNYVFDINGLFCDCCVYGNLEILLWIHNLYKKIDIHVVDKYFVLIRDANIIKYLLKFDKITSFTDNEKVVRRCKNIIYNDRKLMIGYRKYKRKKLK
jgi:hypothetical protein